MAAVFEDYERQYCDMFANLSQLCATIGTLDEDKKWKKMTELKTMLDEGDSLIRRMDLEARSLPATQRAIMLGRLRTHKSDLNGVKREVKALAVTKDAASSRAQLFDGKNKGFLEVSAEQDGRMRLTDEKLNESGLKIKDSQRVVYETEELGVSILQDLHQQRERLIHTTNRLHGVDDNIGKSKMILSAMSKRLKTNKWILTGIIGFLLLLIIIVVSSRPKRSKH